MNDRAWYVAVTARGRRANQGELANGSRERLIVRYVYIRVKRRITVQPALPEALEAEHLLTRPEADRAARIERRHKNYARVLCAGHILEQSKDV